MTIDTLIKNTFDEVAAPIIGLLLAAAVIVFLWGIAEFVRDAESEEGRNKGKRHMLWGIVGITIMLSVFGITGIIFDSLNTDGDIGFDDPAELVR